MIHRLSTVEPVFNLEKRIFAEARENVIVSRTVTFLLLVKLARMVVQLTSSWISREHATINGTVL